VCRGELCDRKLWRETLRDRIERQRERERAGEWAEGEGCRAGVAAIYVQYRASLAG